MKKITKARGFVDWHGNISHLDITIRASHHEPEKFLLLYMIGYAYLGTFEKYD